LRTLVKGSRGYEKITVDWLYCVLKVKLLMT
jgi:hypothetical protein